MKKRNAGGFLYGLMFFMVFRISSWICSVPMWLTLILHFLIGLPIFWFWLTLAAWISAGVIRYLTICFARRGADTAPNPPKENKNPYSAKNKY